MPRPNSCPNIYDRSYTNLSVLITERNADFTPEQVAERVAAIEAKVTEMTVKMLANRPAPPDNMVEALWRYTRDLIREMGL
jgi:hypothetical protein